MDGTLVMNEDVITHLLASSSVKWSASGFAITCFTCIAARGQVMGAGHGGRLWGPVMKAGQGAGHGGRSCTAQTLLSAPLRRLRPVDGLPLGNDAPQTGRNGNGSGGSSSFELIAY